MATVLYEHACSSDDQSALSKGEHTSLVEISVKWIFLSVFILTVCPLHNLFELKLCQP